jgi:hypothetical protein
MKKILCIFMLMACYTTYGFEFNSGVNKVPLLELYSTQSCSSCPAAQEIINSYKSHPELYKKFIPIVFHVDYWDYLGWKDPYSKKIFSQRQRSYASEWDSSRVYTPMFVLNGKEHRKRDLDLITPTQKVGILKVSDKEKVVTIAFKPINQNIKPAYINIALLGRDIKTKVRSGENGGKTLAHEFLVLKHKRKLIKIKDGKVNLKLQHSFLEDFDGYKKSFAVWIEDDHKRVIQSVGGEI